MRHLDLFSGIGGFALATEMVWQNVEHEFVEKDLFCQAVLRKHWPNSPIYDDIKKYDATDKSVDLITGGFPCQPFSGSGKRAGTQDDRHLWPEMLRVIREIHPRWIIGENVDGLVTWNRGLVLESILADLADAQYETQCFIIPAAAVAAPHRRDRIWIVAHANGIGSQEGQRKEYRKSSKKWVENTNDADRRSAQMAYANSGDVKRRNVEKQKGREKQIERPFGLCGGKSGRFAKWPIEPSVGRVAHGVPSRVDRIKSLGNAIVPQVAAEIMLALKNSW